MESAGAALVRSPGQSMTALMTGPGVTLARTLHRMADAWRAYQRADDEAMAVLPQAVKA